MRIGIQGERGSACDEAAAQLIPRPPREASFHYLTSADGVLTALVAGGIDVGVLAAESPAGIPVPETQEAFVRHPFIEEISEFLGEVRHRVMVLPMENPLRVERIASHPIPLQKHREFLQIRFPGYEAVEIADTGLAARLLSGGSLCEHTAVVALPRAAEIFGLHIIETHLPANDDYLTRFVLVRRVREGRLSRKDS